MYLGCCGLCRVLTHGLIALLLRIPHVCLRLWCLAGMSCLMLLHQSICDTGG